MPAALPPITSNRSLGMFQVPPGEKDNFIGTRINTDHNLSK
jgi:hypothetical protein